MTITAGSPSPSRTRPAAPAVELRDVTKRFGKVTAVDRLSLSIPPGQVVALLGPNGAGKSTTIDLVLGLAEPTEGSVQVLGRRPRQAVAAGYVSAVLQSGGLLKDYTVAETVQLVASLFGAEAAVAAAMARAGVTGFASRRVGTCSGGEQQRLRFALALLPDPQVLVLDEPTAGMDVSARHAFWSAVRADAATGRTVVFATHYLEEADAYADRVVLVGAGRVVADGSAAQIKAHASGHLLTATLPGADPAELAALPGVEHVDLRGDTVCIRGRNSDAVARHLLTRTTARDLQITPHSLDEAFLALTADPATSREETR